MLVLNDLDIFRYRCAFAAEKSWYLVELTNPNDHKEYREFGTKKEADSYGDRTTKGVSGASFLVWSRKDTQPVENALNIVKQSLAQTYEAIENKFNEKLEIRAFLSGDTNFRDGIAKSRPYKGNRKESQRPVYYKEIGEYLVSWWSGTYSQGMEADDAIGIAAMEAKAASKRYIIVSNDKDLSQIPGLHYDWIRKEFFEISPKEAKSRFFIQLLAGDATDNIPGLPGIGEITAAKILAKCESPIEMIETVAEQYKSLALLVDGRTQTWQDYLLEQAQLVYILRHPNEYWDVTKEGTYFIEKYYNGLYKEKEQEQISTASQRT